MLGNSHGKGGGSYPMSDLCPECLAVGVEGGIHVGWEGLVEQMRSAGSAVSQHFLGPCCGPGTGLHTLQTRSAGHCSPVDCSSFSPPLGFGGGSRDQRLVSCLELQSPSSMAQISTWARGKAV